VVTIRFTGIISRRVAVILRAQGAKGSRIQVKYLTFSSGFKFTESSLPLVKPSGEIGEDETIGIKTIPTVRSCSTGNTLVWSNESNS